MKYLRINTKKNADADLIRCPNNFYNTARIEVFASNSMDEELAIIKEYPGEFNAVLVIAETESGYRIVQQRNV